MVSLDNKKESANEKGERKADGNGAQALLGWHL
jgi:hypothetical protein